MMMGPLFIIVDQPLAIRLWLLPFYSDCDTEDSSYFIPHLCTLLNSCISALIYMYFAGISESTVKFVTIS